MCVYLFKVQSLMKFYSWITKNCWELPLFTIFTVICHEKIWSERIISEEFRVKLTNNTDFLGHLSILPIICHDLWIITGNYRNFLISENHPLSDASYLDLLVIPNGVCSNRDELSSLLFQKSGGNYRNYAVIRGNLQ